MAKAKVGRLTLQLDLHIAFEALILNRLDRLPSSRHQEWLRGLLVQGFRAECQLLRNVPEQETSKPKQVFSDWLSTASQKPSPEQGSAPTATLAPAAAQGTDKPFARLRSVIG